MGGSRGEAGAPDLPPPRGKLSQEAIGFLKTPGTDLIEKQLVYFIRTTLIYTTLTNFSMKYHLMCKVYTDVGGIK